MSTTRQLIDRLERDVAMLGAVPPPEGVEREPIEAVKGPEKAPAHPSVYQFAKNAPVKEEGSVPFTPGMAESKPVITAPQAGVEPEGNSFYDMIVRNDAYRLANAEAFERNERANKSRLALAAVTDALASLGNLVGTTQGAFSQPQTYQVPFVAEQVEADRTRARSLAERIQQNEHSLRMAKAREDMTNYANELRKEIEEEKTRRALAGIQGRSDLAREKHGYATEENEQKGDIRKDIAQMNNASAEKRTGITAGTSRANALTRDAFNRDKLEAQKNGEIGGSGGGVGGYTTTTRSEYDELGRKIGETKTRTPAGGPTTTTTTTTASGKKPNPMGPAPSQGGKKKKKNPMS